jgi:hypothetical protein
MKTTWIVAGLGVLAAVVGAVMWLSGNATTIGLILILGGMVVAIMAVVMQLVVAAMADKQKVQAKS